MGTDAQIEQEIQAKGLTAARVTLADVEANIANEVYFTAADGVSASGDGVHSGVNSVGPATMQAIGLLTFCVLVLRNGFTVTGESACASSKNFDAELGRKIARDSARQKVWALMGYELKSKLANQT